MSRRHGEGGGRGEGGLNRSWRRRRVCAGGGGGGGGGENEHI